MKYCPYCGASLVGGAASFCAECGKKIPAQTEAPQSKPKPKGKTSVRERPAPKQKRRSPTTGPAHPAKRKRNPMDINYDGYEDRARDLLKAFEAHDPDGVLLALSGRRLHEHGVAAGIWQDGGESAHPDERE